MSEQVPLSNYDRRGVSASKEEVHAAIRHLDKGLYPTAFCKILPDVAAGDTDYCNILHADTAGTKTSLAYLYWKETGDLSVWPGVTQDSIVMNLDDMACVGCTDQILLSSTIGRNKTVIPGEVVAAVIKGASDFADKMKEYGIHLHLAGGETADVGDIVRTIDVGFTAFARMRRDEVVVNHIQAGDVVVGLASFGQAHYEDSYNGGMGSNGLTSARHDVLHHQYADQYPESFDPALPKDVVYIGQQRLTDLVEVDGHQMTVGKLILSPTRTYLPVLREILDRYRKQLHGIIHCSGGGQTKPLKFIENKHIIKDNLFDPPTLFQLIQQNSQASWKEMYQVFNMGHRMELYVAPQQADALIQVAESYGIAARVVGRVEEAPGATVTVRSNYGVFQYRG
jgi:phosphoribosylformylglycinamidine cyclo-ligase